MEMNCNVNELVESYSTYLEVKNDVAARLFKNRLNAEREAAYAEAIVFNFLKGQDLEVGLYENTATGGLDFICKKGTEEFLVEATSIGIKAVSNRTTLPKEPLTEDGFSFNLLTQSIHQRIKDKSKQAAGQSKPCVLAIVMEHWANSILFDTLSCAKILTGDTDIRLNFCNRETKEFASLKNSSFVRLNKAGNKLESCRRTLSAVLLISAHNFNYSVLGCLHPEPTYEFQISSLPEVPFARLKSWPPVENKLIVEWKTDRPKALSDFYFTINLSEKDLIKQ